MKQVTKLMIREFNIKKLGYDFMGYTLNKGDELTFHHLIVPKRKNGKMVKENGAIIQRVPHDYLHLIEAKDYDIFCFLTSEMIDMNVKGYLDIENIRNIHALLSQFEKEHCGDRGSKGKLLIKEEYTRRLKL